MMAHQDLKYPKMRLKTTTADGIRTGFGLMDQVKHMISNLGTEPLLSTFFPNRAVGTRLAIITPGQND